MVVNGDDKVLFTPAVGLRSLEVQQTCSQGMGLDIIRSRGDVTEIEIEAVEN